ncbi:MAG: MBOAT family O-acyltransferase [Lachnospiraceae bacterium]
MIVNFAAGKLIDINGQKKKSKRRAVYILTVTVDVLVLAFFKLIPQVSRLSSIARLSALSWVPEGIGLPLGISFYTFQILSYLTDVYRGDIRAEKSLVRLGTYISMFPQLVAGPIVNYSEVSADLRKRSYRLADVDKGLKNFVWGLTMKVLLADRLSILWHEMQTTGFISISTPLAWMGAIGYSMQIYFDFYGYSLMAVGLGQMLGFSLPENFNMPYMAKSVRDFYRRWHMTLGRWFKNYVYIPLGGSRKGMLRTVFNLFLVWVLTSFWHGGSINFLLWGLSLWMLIVLERLLDRKGRLDKSKVFSHIYVLLVIPLTWMCFAIPELADLKVYFGRMFGFIAGQNVNAADFSKALGNYGPLFLTGIVLCTPVPKHLFERYKDTIVGMLILAGLFWLCVWRIMVEGNNPFMYFRF